MSNPTGSDRLELPDSEVDGQCGTEGLTSEAECVMLEQQRGHEAREVRIELYEMLDRHSAELYSFYERLR